MNLVKLGGSVLTIKGETPTLREAAIDRLAAELAEAGDDLTLVHGAGSYGHPQARRAFGDGIDPMALAQTHRAVATLNLRVVEALHDQGVPAVTLSGNTLARASGGELVSFDTAPFAATREAGLVPVTHGDVVPDETERFAVISGDDFMVELAEALTPERAVFVTDVDGLHDRDPRDHEDARLLEEVTGPGDLDATGAQGTDVTGGMGGKLDALLSIAGQCETWVINGLVEGRLTEVLKGGKVVGTRVRRP